MSKNILWAVGFILFALLVVHKAWAAQPHLPPSLKSEIPGKVCMAIFDKHNDLVGIDCNLPKVKDNGKVVTRIKKGP